ncbi:MAG: membrane protein insertase YidC [Bacteroidales bacterium]|jgi:YidC/Oxa1 family membrane protein insertase|nr:membrane protein insertase YidC [Bacteroidales bacterium]NLM93058.1 membrane protein insertase YidC [Bacteroidales bacterium]
MSRDNIIGLILIGAILIGYSLWMRPSQEELMETRRIQDSINIAEQQRMADQQAQLELQAAQQDTLDFFEDIQAADISELDSVQQLKLADRMGSFAGAAVGTTEFITLENEVLKLNISTKGGYIHSAELKDYLTWEKEPLILFEGEDNAFTLNFFAANRSISTSELFFKPFYADTRFNGQSEIFVEGSDSTAFAMRLYSEKHSPGSPSYVEYFYGLKGNDYMLDFHVNFVGMQPVIASNTTFLNLDWHMLMPRQEKSLKNEQNNTTVYYKYVNDDVERLRETRDSEQRMPTSIRWVSFKQQFFSATLISPRGFDNGDISSKLLDEADQEHTKFATVSLNLAYDPRVDNLYPMSLYLGPNHYQTLKNYDLDLERQIPLGWSFFLMAWINKYAIIPVFNFLDGFNLNYGIIILILTVLLKIFLLPIAYKTHIGQAKQRLLKPEVEEINKRYPKQEDAMKKQQATMALYKKAGVNQMAGCVPMLLQLPILLAMFRFFPASIELRQQSFLWADDLSSYDSILDLPFNIPFYGDHVSLFTLLMTISTIIYTHMNNQMMGSSNQMPGMKTMMYIMPVMFLGIFNNFASGLSYYYFLTNVLTFAQVFLIKQFIDENKLHQEIKENMKKPLKKSKWMERMEAAQKQQEAQRRKK